MEDKKISIGQDDVLILTQCFYDDGRLSYQEHLELYKTMADYIFPGRHLWVKRSKEDFTDYGKVLGAGQVADRKTPLARIPQLLEGKGGCFACFAEEGKKLENSGLKNSFAEFVSLEESFLQSWRKAAKYVAALALLQKAYAQVPKMGLAGIDETFLKVMAAKRFAMEDLSMEKLEDFAEISSGTVWLIDAEYCQLDRENLKNALSSQPDDTMIILLQSEGLDLLYDRKTKNIETSLMPLPLVIESRNGMDKRTENIYIISNNEEHRKAVNNLEMNMENKHLQETVRSQSMDEKDIRIKALEGILEATENRLLYYIDKCNLLKSEKINELVTETVNNYIGQQSGRKKKIG